MRGAASDGRPYRDRDVSKARAAVGPDGLSPLGFPAGSLRPSRGPRFRHEGEVVAEPKPVPLRTLQFEYRFDRLLPEKLAQAYQVLRLVTSKCFLETDG